ncbi:hypothetical protein BSKO_05589 [Bryopsis sp. KO-2023]|nr:hypothetical protein BSKO_05589 [Bryopsis sp. KO-2023]
MYGQPPSGGNHDAPAPISQARSMERDYGLNIHDPQYPNAGGGLYGALYINPGGALDGEGAAGQGIRPRHQRHQSNPEHFRSGVYGSYPPPAHAHPQGGSYSVANPYMNAPPADPNPHESQRIGDYPHPRQTTPLLHHVSMPPMTSKQSFDVKNPYIGSAAQPQAHVPFAGPPPPHPSGNSIGVYPNVSALSIGGRVGVPGVLPGGQFSPGEGGRVLTENSSMGSSYSSQTHGGSASEVYPPYLPHQGSSISQSSISSVDSGVAWVPLRRRALLIGCNYERNNNQHTLQGCVEDVRNMRFFLINKFGFSEEDLCVMTDDPEEGDLLPTRENILRKLDWLVEGASEGTSLVFHFAGHGIQVPSRGDDEEDGLDECIVPCDAQDVHDGIIDNVMNEKLVRPLAHGVVLHAIFDNCHSGTILDLNYRLNSQGEWLRTKTKDGKAVMGKDTSGGLAIQFGACRDNQVALDTQEMHGMVHTGAATYAFIHAFEVDRKYTYGGVLSVMVNQIREKMGKKGEGKKSIQTPQLCCNTNLSIAQRIAL